MILEDSGVSALVLAYLWTKSPSAGISVTDLPQIQRCHQPYAAEKGSSLYRSSQHSLVLIVLGINMKLSRYFR